MLPIYAFGLFAAVTNPRATAAGLLVIGDAKRGDIGTTAAAYAAATLAEGLAW